MIDVSDGLSTDLDHLCEESQVGAEIEEAAIPRAPIGRPEEPVALEFALHGGDDYELLFTSAARIPPTVSGVKVTRIGRITKSMGMRLVGREAGSGKADSGKAGKGKTQKLKPGGWEHFTKK